MPRAEHDLQRIRRREGRPHRHAGPARIVGLLGVGLLGVGLLGVGLLGVGLVAIPGTRVAIADPGELGDATAGDGCARIVQFECVIERARRLAGEAYRPPPASPALAAMSYDEYRSIRFRPERARWRGSSNFEVQLFYPGYLYPDAVILHEIDGAGTSSWALRAEDFRFEGNAAAWEPTHDVPAHPSGFRVHYPLHGTPADETIVFLGASYFRLLSAGQSYGLSARGIAVDTAADQAEEFPLFREFWLRKPSAAAEQLTIYALLDGPSLSGAYRFELRPGESSELEIEAVLFARRDVHRLGVAPLTSMFLHRAGQTPRFVDDFRPQVHDSDGLLMETSSGEWIWRPLKNPRLVRTTALLDREPRGFGLLQRSREFTAYLDLEARYERRPSYWVEPLGGDWGAGSVALVEIPTTSEAEDNIVAFWAPDAPFAAGESRHYRYRLSALHRDPAHHPLLRVARTQIGRAALPGVPLEPPEARRFAIDFEGPAGAPPSNGELAVQAELTSSSGRVNELVVQALPEQAGWRASFRLEPQDGLPADMRLRLLRDGGPLTETWSYVWYPDDRDP